LKAVFSNARFEKKTLKTIELGDGSKKKRLNYGDRRRLMCRGETGGIRKRGFRGVICSTTSPAGAAVSFGDLQTLKGSKKA